MSRPTMSDPRIREIAFEKIWPNIERWLKQLGDEPEDRDKDSAREILDNAGWQDDGYELARDFDRNGWCPDSELVDILDDYPAFIHRAHNEMVAEWVKQDSIKPQLTVGTMVSFTYRGTPTVGEITAVYEDRAEYSVFVESLGHKRAATKECGSCTLGVLVKYEECTKL